MAVHSPDRWVVLKFQVDGENLYKVLASWYGGYLGSDSWRLNSGVTSVEEDGDCLLFRGASGSTYRCRKDSYGMSTYTLGVLASFHKRAGDFTIEVMPDYVDWIAELNS